MIYTITLNPALDKTLIIENFSINKLNRVMSLRKDAGGKGINVSKMLNKFEEETCAMGFLGHDSGKFIQKFLTDEGIETDFVINNDIETRTNIKIVDTLSSTYTDINEPGGKILYEDIIKLENKLLYRLNKNDIVVFAGKVANGMDESIIKKWSIKCKEKGVKVFVDAEGDALRLAVEAKPYLIKPNVDELRSITDRTITSNLDMIIECQEIIKKGVSIVALSMGEHGAMFFNNDDIFYAKALEVEVKSTVGAGDSMMAALAYGIYNSICFEDVIRLSVATSTAKVMCDGTQVPNKSLVFDILKKVRIKKIDKGAIDTYDKN